MAEEEISIILPTVNERENLEKLVPALQNLNLNLEIIVVDDGSTDGTVEFVEKCVKKYSNMKLVARPAKLGLGSAYIDGFKVSKGKYIVTMDADLSHNPKYIPLFLNELKDKQADIVLGSRYVEGGRIIGWKVHRKIISKTANFIAKTILGLNVNDVTTGFRMYRREAFEKIISRIKAKGYEFQVESLYIAKLLGLKIVEYPIVFVNRVMGKSKLKLSDIVRFLRTVLKLKLIA